MKPNYGARHYIKIAGLAALPLLTGASVFAGQAFVTLALGLIGTLGVVGLGVYQWRQWQALLKECDDIATGHVTTAPTETQRSEFSEVLATFGVLENRRRKVHDAFHRHLDETRDRLAQLADSSQAPKALTATKIEGLETIKLDGAIGELHKAITHVKQRMAGMTRLLASLPEPFIIVDDAEKIRYLNTAAEQLLGKKLAECSKQPFTNFLAANSYGDPLGRAVVTADVAHAWLTNGSTDEVVGDLVNVHGQMTRVAFAIARPTSTDRERLYCIAARPLAKQYGQVGSLLRNTRTDAVHALWHGVDETLNPSAEQLQTQVRLLTAEVKQSSLRNTLMGRVQALQQISNRVDLFLKINHWFGLCIQNQLPAPQPMELTSFDIARLLADKLNPILKTTKTSIVAHNDGAGWVFADEDWLQVSLLGLLWHTSQAAAGNLIDLHVSQREPDATNPEGSVAFSIAAPVNALTPDVLGQWETAFDGVALPKWLDPETPGYLPGVQVARYLITQMGGTLTLDTASRSLSIQLLLPARVPGGNTTPADRHDGPALEELCMGWTLGVA